MTLVALANALLRRSRWSSAFTPTRGCRRPSCCCRSACRATSPTIEPRPLDEMRVAAPPPAGAGAALPLAAHAVPAHAVPVERQLRRPSSPTPAAAPASGAACAVTRWRRDATRDADGQFIYLRDVRSGAVWSADLSADAARAGRLRGRRSRAERATFRRRDDDISTQLDVAVSTEDDVEVRRLTVAQPRARASARSRSPATRRSSSRRPADDLAHPAFGKLFIETEYLAESAALLCHGGRAIRGEPGAWAFHVAEPRGPAAGPGRMGDRSRALPRPRPRARPIRWRSTAARCRARPASCSIRSSACASGSGCRPARRCGSRFATGIASDRETAEALARKYHDPSAAARTFALAFTHAQSGLRHLGISRDEALLFERLASRVLGTDGSLRAGADTLAVERARSGRPVAARASPAICRSCSCASSATTTCRWCGRCCRRRSTGGSRACSADVVILNEHPVSYLDEMQAQLTALLDDGPWRTWQHRPGRRLPAARRPDGPTPSASLLEAVARAVLRGDRGDLRAQLDRPGAHAAAGDAASCRRRRRAGDRRPRRSVAAADDADERARRLHRRRPEYAIVARRRAGNAAALGERDRQPGVRHHRHGVGLGAHLVRRTAARTG